MRVFAWSLVMPVLPTDNLQQRERRQGHCARPNFAGEHDLDRRRQCFTKAEDVHHHFAPRRPSDPSVRRLDAAERHEVDRQVASVPQSMRGGCRCGKHSGTRQAPVQFLPLGPAPHRQGEIDVLRLAKGLDFVRVHQVKIAREGANDQRRNSKRRCGGFDVRDDRRVQAKLTSLGEVEQGGSRRPDARSRCSARRP